MLRNSYFIYLFIFAIYLFKIHLTSKIHLRYAIPVNDDIGRCAIRPSGNITNYSFAKIDFNEYETAI